MLSEPLASSADVDFVCFTDSALHRDIWRLRPVVRRLKTAQLTARWHKLNPHLLFPDYEYSLWVDGNVIPSSSELYDTLNGLVSKSVKWAGIKHPQRDDVYEEAYRIYSNGRDRFFPLARTLNFLKREGFPRHWGMMETNVLLRAHHDEDVRRCDELWCSLLMQYTGRDQMTHSYAMWKSSIPMVYLLPEGSSARNHPAFTYVPHDKPYVKDASLKGRLSDLRSLLKRFAFRLFLKFLV